MSGVGVREGIEQGAPPLSVRQGVRVSWVTARVRGEGDRGGATGFVPPIQIWIGEGERTVWGLCGSEWVWVVAV